MNYHALNLSPNQHDGAAMSHVQWFAGWQPSTSRWTIPLARLIALSLLLTCAPLAVAGQEGEAVIYRVLQFHGLGSHEIEPKTQSVEDGLDLAGFDGISDADILASTWLRKVIRDYYEALPVYRMSAAVHSGRALVRSEIDLIHDLEILARSGNRLNVRIRYLWVIPGWPSTGRFDSAEVLLDLIPAFTNTVYDRERYSAVLVPEDSYFPELAREFADLGLTPAYDERDCEHNYHSPQNCALSIPLYFDFLEREQLPHSVDTAFMFQAFVRGEYARADRLYARAKGYELPKYEGVGTEVAEVVRQIIEMYPESFAGTFNRLACAFNYYHHSPCHGVIAVWRDFSARHGLDLSLASANVFMAYAEGSYRRGDRLYRAAKGIPEEKYIGPGVAVMALGLNPAVNLQRDCLHDPTAPNPCADTITVFEEFAATHGLPVDSTTAAIFDAYIRHDTVRGDFLYARAKGIPIEAVGDPDYQPSEPGELIIDIVPPTSPMPAQ